MSSTYTSLFGLPYDSPEMIRIENFLSWMKANGAIFDKARMKYYALDYRGVHAHRGINAKEIILNIPKSLIITSRMGKETPIGIKVLKANIPLYWDYVAYLTIFLATEINNSKSFYKPYLDVLPKTSSNFPLFYSDYEKSLLRGSYMFEHIKQETGFIKEEYDSIVGAAPEFATKARFEEYMRLKVLVISRMFYVKMGGQIERVLVPLADMFNYHHGKAGETYWKFNEETNSFQVSAQKIIPKGDPVRLYLLETIS